MAINHGCLQHIHAVSRGQAACTITVRRIGVERFHLVETLTVEQTPLAAAPPIDRTVVFICKATPSDDEFALWLAPKLEAAGYNVFADVLTLEPGDRWRSVITSTLQKQAAKMLLP